MALPVPPHGFVRREHIHTGTFLTRSLRMREAPDQFEIRSRGDVEARDEAMEMQFSVLADLFGRRKGAERVNAFSLKVAEPVEVADALTNTRNLVQRTGSYSPKTASPCLGTPETGVLK